MALGKHPDKMVVSDQRGAVPVLLLPGHLPPVRRIPDHDLRQGLPEAFQPDLLFRDLLSTSTILQLSYGMIVGTVMYTCLLSIEYVKLLRLRTKV